MIIAKGIEKSYGTLKVLKNINIEIKHNEIVAIAGPSGAGKSTLLHILGTIDKADKGEIIINEQNITNTKSSKLSDFRSQNIGFVFQHHHLLPEFTAVENVCIPAYISKKNKTKTIKKAKELLYYLGLSDRLEHKPSQLSGGELQRIAVARALINDPKIILADEPSGNLDTQNAEELHKLFLELRKKLGQTFIIVTHNQQLAQMSDRVIKMKDGEIV
ncbi:MAG: ABC transporter ATP-binding protein [Bacteroidota bacterium]|nr:ABC transporter ATP-binding protein [Bacteroidota bacterium]